MNRPLYTLIYATIFLVTCWGCVSTKRNTEWMEKERSVDSLRSMRVDRQALQRLQQSAIRMEMRLQQISYTSPDSLGQQYIQRVTLAEGRIEAKDTAVTYAEQENREESRSNKTFFAEKKGGEQKVQQPFALSCRCLLSGILPFIVLLTICYPAIKKLTVKKDTK